MRTTTFEQERVRNNTVGMAYYMHQQLEPLPS